MTLWDSSTHVPLLIRDRLDNAKSNPSRGKGTSSPAQLLDMFPTLAALAGLSFDLAGGANGGVVETDGVDLSPLFADPNKVGVSTAAFSQQAKCYQKDKATPHPTPTQQLKLAMMTCEFVDRTEMDFMGYSIRNGAWRYTEWCAWNGTAMKPLWSTASSVGIELYDHRGDVEGQLDSENANVAHMKENEETVAALSKELHEHFEALWAKRRVYSSTKLIF